MKKRIYFILTLSLLTVLLFCGFTFDKNSSLKDLTHPYINTYVCTAAKLGNEDLLEKYEYFQITFLDEKELEVSFKRKNGGKRFARVCDYSYDNKTGELSAEMGIFGYKVKQATKIKNGKFTVSMNILGKPLLMNFAVK